MIVLVAGPECSGKTSLCQAIASELGFTIIPEYAVSYLDSINRNYTYEDLSIIAKGHWQVLEKSVQKTDRIVLDTFLVNIWIWSEYRFGKVDEWITDRLREFDPELVLLMKPDLPWEAGEYRENPGDRDVLFNAYKEKFDRLGWDYHIIDQLGSERTSRSIELIESLLSAE